MSTRLLAIITTILMAAVLVLGINQVLLRRDIDKLEDRLGAIATRTLPPTEQVATKTCAIDQQLQDIQAWMAVEQGAASTGGVYIAPEWCPEG